MESLGTLTAFESRKLIDYYALPDVAVVAVGGDLERIAAMETNAVDASTSAVPSNIVAEKRGFPTLLRIGAILEIPRPGSAARTRCCASSRTRWRGRCARRRGRYR